MKRDRHSKRHNSSWKDNSRKNYYDEPKTKKVFYTTIKSVTPEQIKKDEEAIKEYKKTHQVICPKCGNVIADMSTAIYDSTISSPAHFDCILAELSKTETLSQGDRLAYIGQGRFGILNYPNVHDNKHFVIKKIIEFESKEEKTEWRDEISDLFSKIR